VIAMQKVIGFALSLLGVSQLAACSKTADEMAETATALAEGLAAVVDRHRDECDKMGSALQSFVDSNERTIWAAAKHEAALNKQERERVRKAYKARVGQAKRLMVDGLHKCRQHPSVAAALRKMRGLSQ
jgi:hypothetical protein